ncbi:MAG: hypothetical protein AABX72_03395, partial [Nanoarchaeota archaeon]
MDAQTKLQEYAREFTPKVLLKLLKPNNDLALEEEKKNFLSTMCMFTNRFSFESSQTEGRPHLPYQDVIKQLLLMSFHGFSYRRAKTDLEELHKSNLISRVLPRSTLCDYANREEIKHVLEQLIQTSALFFKEYEDTLIMDSTWFGLRMYTGGFRKVHDKTSSSLEKCRKLHLAILKNSKIITYAIP